MKVNPSFIKEVEKFGAFDIRACFNCGNCTAICPLSGESTSFPRRMIHYAQLGLEKKILERPDIWLCDYCAQCSETCPRQAEPGEFMMALRRYAISKYSWTKISRKMYESPIFTTLFIGVPSLLFIALILMFHGPLNMESVSLFSFLPVIYIEVVAIALGGFVTLSALINLVRMYRLISWRPLATQNPSDTDLRSIGRLWTWLKELVVTVVKEVVVQLQYAKCEEGVDWFTRLKSHWFTHITIVWGFLGLALATSLRFILDQIPHWLRSEFWPAHKIVPITDPIRLLGTFSGIILVYGTSVEIFRRITKADKPTSYSAPTDWIFLLLLFLSGLSGFLLEIALYANSPLWSYITLTLHLILTFQLFLLAPFTKFAHSIYRPMILWMNKVYQRT